ncbi:MAG: hypothetical protein PVF74_10890 [Anaerolineales bacterium]
MKVIDNPNTDQKDSSSSQTSSVLSSLRFGRNWAEDMKAQDTVVNSFGRMLDNNYLMLRNVTLEGLDIPIPLILVGPPGLSVIYPSASRGIFRASEEKWEKLQDRQRGFKLVQPNIITRVRLMAQAVSTFLTTSQYSSLEVEPVIMFTDPGTHVETAHPAARIVHSDGLDRFIAGLFKARVLLSRPDANKIANMLMGPKIVSEEGDVTAPEDEFSFAEQGPPPGPSLADQIPKGEGVVKSINKVPFSMKQWLVLGLLIVVNIFVLLALVVLILFS